MRKIVDMQRITNNAMSKALLWQFWGNAALSGGLYENHVCLFSVYMSMRTFASTVVTTFSNLSRCLKIQS